MYPFLVADKNGKTYALIERPTEVLLNPYTDWTRYEPDIY
jgi:hypothetical protein